ncbi:MAG: cyclic nucleotide-binding domain-containing protein [Bacteroidota bacterium]
MHRSTLHSKERPIVQVYNWRDAFIFHNLSQEELAHLNPLIKTKHLKAGEVLFEEGDEGDGIFVIQEGEIEIYKGKDIVLSNMICGQSFGGISTFSQQPRSAGAKALTKTHLAWLDKDGLEQLSVGGLNSISNKILNNCITLQRKIQENSDNKIVEDAKRKLEIAREQIEFGTFFVTIVFFVSLYAFAIRSGAEWIDNFAAKTYLTVGLLLVMLITVGIGLRGSQYTLKDYGFHTRNWQIQVPLALLWTLGFMLFATFLKFLLVTFVDAYKGQSIISLPGYMNVDTTTAIATTLLYCIFAPVQEFLARGLTQSSLSRFLKGKHVDAKAILITTLLFSTTHLHLNTYFALAVILPSIFWGIMFARQKSLLGVSISHIIIGIYVAFIMGGLE